MAIFHVKVDKILKGERIGGGKGFAHYIAREELERGSQHAWYLQRESYPAKEDLVYAGHANLPSWAHGLPAHFFHMADRYERKGGLVARTWEIALPRELSLGQHKELVEDIQRTFFLDHPHAFAIHNPQGQDGHDQPHVHFMVNERVRDGIERGPKHFFCQAAARGKDPATGGARKDLSWNPKDRLVDVRAGIAILTNAALERAGHTVVVDPRPIKDRGYQYNRAPEREQTQRERYLMHQGKQTAHWKQTLADRERLRQHFYPYEQRKAQQFWVMQKEREGLQSVDRLTIQQHVHERFWSGEKTRQGLQRAAMEVWWANERAMGSQARAERAYTWVLQREKGREQAHQRKPQQRTYAPGREAREDSMRQGVSVTLDHEYGREKML